MTKKGKKNKKDKKTDGLSKEEKMAQKELKKKQMQELCQKKNKKATSGLANVKKYIDKTKPGEKKDLSGELPEYYDPSYVESAWDDWWQKEQFFKVDLKEALKVPREKRFVMLLPPPKITGSIHLGHAFMTAIEETITRYKRLKGFVPLWVPSVDHAGISTQSVVEKKLLKNEGKFRNDYTREEFVNVFGNGKKNMEIE